MRFRDVIIQSIENEPGLLKGVPRLRELVNQLKVCDDPDIINVASIRLWTLINTYGILDFLPPDISFLSEILDTQSSIIGNLNAAVKDIILYYERIDIDDELEERELLPGIPQIGITHNEDGVGSSIPGFVKDNINERLQIMAVAYSPDNQHLSRKIDKLYKELDNVNMQLDKMKRDEDILRNKRKRWNDLERDRLFWIDIIADDDGSWVWFQAEQKQLNEIEEEQRKIGWSKIEWDKLISKKNDLKHKRTQIKREIETRRRHKSSLVIAGVILSWVAIYYNAPVWNWFQLTTQTPPGVSQSNSNDVAGIEEHKALLDLLQRYEPKGCTIDGKSLWSDKTTNTVFTLDTPCMADTTKFEAPRSPIPNPTPVPMFQNWFQDTSSILRKVTEVRVKNSLMLDNNYFMSINTDDEISLYHVDTKTGNRQKVFTTIVDNDDGMGQSIILQNPPNRVGGKMIVPYALFDVWEYINRYKDFWIVNTALDVIQQVINAGTDVRNRLFKPVIVNQNITSVICPEDKSYSKLGSSGNTMLPCDMIFNSDGKQRATHFNNYYEIVYEDKLRSVIVDVTCTSGAKNFCTADIHFLPEEFTLCKRKPSMNTISDACRSFMFHKRKVAFDEYGNSITDPIELDKFQKQFPTDTAKSTLEVDFQALSGNNVTEITGGSHYVLNPSNIVTTRQALITSNSASLLQPLMWLQFIHGFPGVYVPYGGNIRTSHPRTYTAGKNKKSNLVLSSVEETEFTTQIIAPLKNYMTNQRWEIVQGIIRSTLQEHKNDFLTRRKFGRSTFIPVVKLDKSTLVIDSILYFQDIESGVVYDVWTTWNDEFGSVRFEDSFEPTNINGNDLWIPAELSASFLRLLDGRPQIFDRDSSNTGPFARYFITKDPQHTDISIQDEISPVYTIQNELSLFTIVKDQCELEKQQFDMYANFASGDNLTVLESFNIGKKVYQLLKRQGELNVASLEVDTTMYEDYGPFSLLESYKILGMAFILMSENILQPFRGIEFVVSDNQEYIRIYTAEVEVKESDQKVLELFLKKEMFENKFSVPLELGDVVWPVETNTPYFSRLFSAGNYTVSKCMANALNDYKYALEFGNVNDVLNWAVSGSGVTYYNYNDRRTN
jgi:hypothetical protein